VRYLVLSDIHGNWPALQAVLAQASGFDQVLFLGDAVGYYPDGDQVVEWLRSVGARGVLGNHDHWMLNLNQLTLENPIVEILRWQAERLSEAQRAYLEHLPWTLSLEGALLVHGSPCDPLTYVDELNEARAAFGCSEARWILHGHTHLAGAYLALEGPSGLWIRYQRYPQGGELVLAPKARALVNPGSVGQPRDGVPGAAYGIWDPERETFELYRISYEVEQVLSRLEEAGFPGWLYRRLLAGK
jgi:predicted phosphodiesterase